MRPVPVCARLPVCVHDSPELDPFAYDYDCARLRLRMTISACDDVSKWSTTGRVQADMAPTWNVTCPQCV